MINTLIINPVVLVRCLNFITFVPNGLDFFGFVFLSPPSGTTKMWIFHPCGAVGPEGPTPSQCLNFYKNTNVNVTVGTQGPFKGVQMWRVQESGTYR